jgi:hypothetical protein
VIFTIEEGTARDIWSVCRVLVVDHFSCSLHIYFFSDFVYRSDELTLLIFVLYLIYWLIRMSGLGF